MAAMHGAPPTPDRPLRIGILGAARIAPVALVKPAKNNPAVELTALAARDLDRARAFARHHAIPTVHASYDRLLEDPTIDAVYIPLPNNLHADWSIRALAAGKHVLCEKPLAANAHEAAAMVAAAASAGRILAEAFHNRYHPLLLRAKELIASGAIGELRALEVFLCTPSLRPHNIRFRYDLAGGATMDLGCYAINMIRYLSGSEPVVLDAHAKLATPQVDRAMEAHFALATGGTARMVCSMRSSCVFRLSLQATGSRGSVTVCNPLLPQLLYHHLDLMTAGQRTRERFPRRATYAYQLDAFVQAVRGEVALPTSGEDGVKNMQVIDAVYRAAGLQPRGS